MQPISEIIKEVGLLVWIFWGISIFAMVMAVLDAIQMKKSFKIKSWFSVLPIHGMVFFFVMMGMILYFSNASVKRQKEFNQSMAMQNERRAMQEGQQVARLESPLTEEKTTFALDRRLQSIEGVIGYLDESIKMGKEPKDLTPIMLFLAKEVKNIRDGD